VKSWQTERAARQLRECLAPDGLALSLQNGLGNEDVLAQALGPQRTARGVTTSGAVLLAPGVARPGGEGQVVLERDARLERLESMLTAANFQIQLVADTRKLVWGKLVASAAINPLTALLRLKNGHLLERGEARRLLGELARETASVAWALGVELPFDDPQAAVEQVIRQTASNSSSMLQDVLRGSRTEVDAINGAVIALGQANGVPTPVNRVVWSLVRALFP
jgi:2-dehydropantoate 2-reductase